MNIKTKLTTYLKIAAVVAVVVLVVIAGAFFLNKTKSGRRMGSKLGLNAPVCPQNLEGILSHPFMDPKYIAALTPLGNISPPGHTSPVDHIYFQTTYDGRIPMYAPADATIYNITTIARETKPGAGDIKVIGYNLQYTICDGLVLDFANHEDVVDTIKNEITKRGKKDCRGGIVKDGHGKLEEEQCYYHVNIPVKAGQQVGWTWQTQHPEGWGKTLAFEIWAANYNVDPPSQTNWKYYEDDRYAHIMCPFDLYTGELKQAYYSKLGRWETGEKGKKDDGKEGKKAALAGGYFIPRNGEPFCGQVDQDIVGTIQGMWFSKPTPKDDYNAKFDGGLAFLHNNVDVNMGEISVGGDLAQGKSGVVFFNPVHSGTVNREPGEVQADGKVYCYTADGQWNSQGKFLVQLVDDHHIKAEIQAGQCSTAETFTKPFFYER